MKTTYTIRMTFVVFAMSLLIGCLFISRPMKNYDEIPPMLEILTNKVQSAFEKGYFDKGEKAVLEYVKTKNPNVLNWFAERGYEIKLGAVGGYAVVVICDNGKPVFEDTYCNAGKPDKDHRDSSDTSPCKITITPEEIQQICDE